MTAHRVRAWGLLNLLLLLPLKLQALSPCALASAFSERNGEASLQRESTGGSRTAFTNPPGQADLNRPPSAIGGTLGNSLAWGAQI